MTYCPLIFQTLRIISVRCILSFRFKLLWSIWGCHQTLWSLPLQNVTWHSGTWPYTMTPNWSIDQTLHQFANLLPKWTLIPMLTLLPNFGGFHRTLQRGRLANRGRLLLRTPGLSHLELAYVLRLRPFFPELVMSTDLLSFEHPSVLLFCFRWKTQRRATLLLSTSIYHCQSVGTVNFALPFTTSVTISISILLTIRSWVAASHLRPPMAFISHNSSDTPGLAPLMNVLFCGQCDFPISFRAGICQRHLKSSLMKFHGLYGNLTKRYEVPLSRILHGILEDDHIQWHPPLMRHYINFLPFTDLDRIAKFAFLPNCVWFP